MDGRELPEGWESIRVEKVKGNSGLITDGDWILSEDLQTGNDVRLIQLADIGIGKFLDKSKKSLAKTRAQELKCTFLKEGDLLVSRMPEPIARACTFPKVSYDAITAVDVTIIRTDLEKVDPKFLCSFFNSNIAKKQVERVTVGTTRKRISRKNLENLIVPLPPLPIQSQIVAVLEQAEVVKRQRHEADALTGALLQSVFREMFGDPVKNERGWEKKELKKFGEIKTGNTPPRINPSNYGDFIEWIKSDNINSQSMNLERSQEFLSEEGLKIGRPAPKKSILITCIAGSISCIGNAAIADRDVTFNQQINAILPKSDVNELFLYHTILMSQGYIQNHATKSMTKMINKGVLSDLLFICPPLALQQQFARIVERVERIRDQQVASGRLIEGLCEGLMQRAFAGELVEAQ